MERLLIIITTFILTISRCFSADTCSRVAIINFQEVLVDNDSTQKGEGLRYHLKRDPLAEHYLNQYQEGNKISWQNAAIGTIGTTMLLSGLLSSGSSGKSRQNLILGGASVMLLNFLVAKTLEHENEGNLMKSIEEHNRRSHEKIYFNPSQNDDNAGPGIFLNYSKEF